MMACTGDLDIQLVLKIEQTVALRVGEDILQLELSADELGEILAELINIVAGHLGHHLTPHGLAISFSLPSVGGHEIYDQTAPATELVFDNSDYNFRFLLVLTTPFEPPAP
jgi:hypothetical protein